MQLKLAVAFILQFNVTCQALWMLAFSLLLTNMFYVFILSMTETASRRTYVYVYHAQNIHVSFTIQAIPCPMRTIFLVKHVSFVLRPNMFWPSMNTV